MSIVVLNHKVKDFKTWKSFFDADAERRSNAGLKQIYLANRADDPNEVQIAFETNDVAKAQQMMSDPDLHAYMEKAGVIGRPTVTVLNKA
jgi:hypothetical protein